MPEPLVLVERRDGGVLRLTLNRPEVRNAFDDRVIRELTGRLEEAGRDEAVRAVVLTGAGEAFSAGGDMNWMRRSAAWSEDENFEDARGLSRMLLTLDRLPKPTVALVNGAAFGGGVGLVACCDLAVAADKAVFSLSEIRLGLIPSTIGPYVLAAIGPRHMRRYALTGERFSAAEAARIGLVHEVVPAVYLENAAGRILDQLLKGGPRAQGAAKRFIEEIRDRPPGPELVDLTARRIAELRASPEGQEGLSAFLDKRPPRWQQRG